MMDSDSAVMLELAAQAFRARNFELAAEIYECQLQSPGDAGARAELALRRADALACAGRLADAFDAYRAAARPEGLRPERLEKLLECLADSVRRKEGLPARGRASDPFACAACLGFLCEPVTLPCGHCVCRKCLERERRPVRCRGCRRGCSSSRGCRESCASCADRCGSAVPDAHRYRVNVVLSHLLSKWFPSQTRAVQLRLEGNALFADKQPDAALRKYDEAIRLAPRDHVLFSNRSLINASLKKFDEALSDAEMACELQPHWLKGHLRKAQALGSLRRAEEALTEYLLCIALEPESKLAKSEALKERIPDCSSLLSSRARIKGSATGTSTPRGIAVAPRPYKECKTSEEAQANARDKPQSPATLGLAEEGATRTPRSWPKGEDGGRSSGFHPALVDRSLLPKRKHGSVEEGQPGVEGGACKRAKTESSRKDAAASWCAVRRELVDAADLDCSLCMRLFYEPVTTACGHTFCLKCLERCLDHNSQCPLCKEDLSEYLAQRRYCKTFLMEELIAQYLPDELVERQKANEEEIAELSNLNKNVPIFVCTMAFPTVPCPLHIFEPCYRLMIRRCMETGTKQFGMCLGDSVKGFADHGCILEIRNVEFFADGRSVVDTIGRRRFKVVRHSQRDGYNTADIEYLEDEKVEGEDEAELRKLHDAVYDQALVWVNSLKAEQKQRIMGHFGPMPEKDPEPQTSPNGPSWCWWLLAVLPLEGRAQLAFLSLASLKERLSGIRRVLLFMSRNRSR
ncbi:LON peptidase N-terminal domain and RING finger protein 3-like isoform X2 [Scleropages formosus]|uniref:LON peptidase N-terminal domain and ring finger 3 n=1 Tax=Scleropages formosus TaxID=113540 RepID=A0A8C9WFL4_SCLFO|nr:LON peptidase N-terminal domain and RING finger protein 3 isoform X2 [Scleropages formosus]